MDRHGVPVVVCGTRNPGYNRVITESARVLTRVKKVNSVEPGLIILNPDQSSLSGYDRVEPGLIILHPGQSSLIRV